MEMRQKRDLRVKRTREGRRKDRAEENIRRASENIFFLLALLFLPSRRRQRLSFIPFSRPFLKGKEDDESTKTQTTEYNEMFFSFPSMPRPCHFRHLMKR